MANTYFDTTGVILIDAATPVIQALYAAYELDVGYPGKGEAYVANLSEKTDTSWNTVIESLGLLAQKLGIPVPLDNVALADDPKALLLDLGRHFKPEGDPALAKLVEEIDFDGNSDFESLATLARCFDDGHGFKGFKVEGSWHCSKPRLFAFGGTGQFGGLHFQMTSSSGDALRFAPQVNSALAENDLDDAAAVLYRYIGGLLDGIASDSNRKAIRAKLGAALTALAGTQPRLFIHVRDGVADYVGDLGVDVVKFDQDDYEADPANTDKVPAHFADLAKYFAAPVEGAA